MKASAVSGCSPGAAAIIGRVSSLLLLAGLRASQLDSLPSLVTQDGFFGGLA